MELRGDPVAAAEARERVRMKLLQAMVLGNYFHLNLGDCVPDFSLLCHESYFPACVIESGAVEQPTVIHAVRSGVQRLKPLFGLQVTQKLIRESDFNPDGDGKRAGYAVACCGTFLVRSEFCVVITSTLSREEYRQKLRAGLDLFKLHVLRS